MVRTLTFSVSDGVLNDSETVTITVDAWPTSGATAVTGRILDANDAANSIETPIAGVTIRQLVTGGASTTSALDGTFTLSGIVPGVQTIEFDGSTAAGSVIYGSYRSTADRIPNVTTTLDRPLYLPHIDTTGQVTVDPNQTTTLINPNIGQAPGVMLVLDPHTVKDETGQDYAGPLSLSAVPPGFTPGALPDTLEPGLIITVQPMGLTFTSPMPVTFPNVDGLAPGSRVALWSLDHSVGAFYIAGTGEVSADGSVIETIDGGMRESSWHFALPFGPTGGGNSGGGGNCGGCKGPSPECSPCGNSSSGGGGDGPGGDGGAGFGSRVLLPLGVIGTGFTLPAYQSVGVSRALNFVYASNWAFPEAVLPYTLGLSNFAAVPPLMTYQGSARGVQEEAGTFIDTSVLTQGAPEEILWPRCSIP